MARDYERILLLARPSIGDVLLATPLLHALRARWPDSTIDVLIYVGHEQILEGNPDIDDVIAVGKHPSLHEYRDQLRRMGRHYDLGMSVSTSDRALLYLLMCARDRYSVVPADADDWRSAWKRWICRDTLSADPDLHTLEQNHRLGMLAGLAPGYAVVPPRCADSDRVLAEALPAVWEREPYAVLHLSPGHPFKRWHLDGWRSLAAWLEARGVAVVLTGGAGAEERSYLDAAAQTLPRGVHDIAGRLRLGHLSLLLERCVLYAGPDTLATHLSAAVGAPTVAIFGPTNPLKWAPWPHGYAGPNPPFARIGTQRAGNVLLVQGPGECVPCQKQGCDRHRWSRSDCLDQIEARTVIAAAERMLEYGPERGAAQASST
jgi:heptosyltransferase-3